MLPSALLVAALTLADVPLVLTDGSVLRVVSAPRVENGLALARLEDGTVVSFLASRIDWNASERRRRAEQAAADARLTELQELPAPGGRRAAPVRREHKARVITNRTIESYSVQQPPGEVPPPSGDAAITALDGPPTDFGGEVRRTPERDDDGQGPGYWRDRARAVRDIRRQAERTLDAARRAHDDEEKVLLYGRLVTDGSFGIREYARTREEVAVIHLRLSQLKEKVRDAEASVEEAKQQEAELRDEARQAGADPGWLRLPVTYR